MADKIIEMTPKQFRVKLQEMVQLEVAKILLEEEDETPTIKDIPAEKLDAGGHLRAERLLMAIHDGLEARKGNPSKKQSRDDVTRENVKGFANWVRKNFGDKIGVDASDDSISVLTKYADYYSKTETRAKATDPSGEEKVTVVPQGKSVKADMQAFFATKNAEKNIDKITAKAYSPDVMDTVKEPGEKSVVTDLEIGSKMEDIGKAIGISKQAVEQLLQRAPMGAGAMIFNLLNKDPSKEVKGFDTHKIEEIFKKAIYKASYRLINLIDEAGLLEPEENMLTKDNLVKVLEKAKVRKDLTANESAKEDMFLEKIAEIMNEYPEDDAHRVILSMVNQDLASRGDNIFKSFQNLVASLSGDDLLRLSIGRSTPEKNKKREENEKEFGKYKLAKQKEKSTDSSEEPV